METDNTLDREERVRARAYAIWLEQGQPYGRADEHWHLANAAIDEEDGATTPLHDLGADPAPLLTPNH